MAEPRSPAPTVVREPAGPSSDGPSSGGPRLGDVQAIERRGASLPDEDFFAQPVAGVREDPAVSDPPPLRRLWLSLGALVAIAWLMAPLVDELRYHFSGTELVDVGDATAIGPDNVPPVGAFVRVNGVLGNKAASLSGVLRPGTLRSGPVQVRQLLGSALFVEFDQERYLDRYTAFTRVTVEGRVVPFHPGGELSRVRAYFEQRLGLKVPTDARLIVVDERPGELWRYPVAFGIAIALAMFSLITALRRLF